MSNIAPLLQERHYCAKLIKIENILKMCSMSFMPSRSYALCLKSGNLHAVEINEFSEFHIKTIRHHQLGYKDAVQKNLRVLPRPDKSATVDHTLSR
jgi:hypothetical protein